MLTRRSLNRRGTRKKLRPNEPWSSGMPIAGDKSEAFLARIKRRKGKRDQRRRGINVAAENLAQDVAAE